MERIGILGIVLLGVVFSSVGSHDRLMDPVFGGRKRGVWWRLSDYHMPYIMRATYRCRLRRGEIPVAKRLNNFPRDWYTDWARLVPYHNITKFNTRIFADLVSFSPWVLFPVSEYRRYHQEYYPFWDYLIITRGNQAFEIRYPLYWNYGLAATLQLTQFLRRNDLAGARSHIAHMKECLASDRTECECSEDDRLWLDTMRELAWYDADCRWIEQGELLT